MVQSAKTFLEIWEQRTKKGTAFLSKAQYKEANVRCCGQCGNSNWEYTPDDLTCLLAEGLNVNPFSVCKKYKKKMDNPIK